MYGAAHLYPTCSSKRDPKATLPIHVLRIPSSVANSGRRIYEERAKWRSSSLVTSVNGICCGRAVKTLGHTSCPPGRYRGYLTLLAQGLGPSGLALLLSCACACSSLHGFGLHWFHISKTSSWGSGRRRSLSSARCRRWLANSLLPGGALRPPCMGNRSPDACMHRASLDARGCLAMPPYH